MNLTLLGTGTCAPSARRASPGLYLEVGGDRLLIDPGPGSLRRLAALGVDYRAIDVVAVTHRHLDHTLDLLHLFFALMAADKGPGGGRTRPLTLLGFPGFREFLARLGQAYGDWVAPAGHARPLLELAPGARFNRPGWRLTAEAMQHLPESLGFRIEADGAALAYTGDTEYCAGAVALARDADLLVSECSAPDDAPKPKHLTPAGVARIVRESGARRVVLVHLDPPPADGGAPDGAGYDEGLAQAVRAQCEAEVTLGVDGLRARLADGAVTWTPPGESPA